MTKSRFGMPYRWSWAQRVLAAVALTFGAIALVFGVDWVPAAYAIHEGRWGITFGCGVCFAYFGGFYVLLLTQQLANRPFPHAADDVLPNVPREPVLLPNEYANAAVTHDLIQTPSGLVLRPRDKPYGWSAWFYGYVWPVFTAAVMITVVTHLDYSLFWKTVLVFVNCLIAATWVRLLHFAFSTPPPGLAVVEIDQLRKTCVITRATESVTVDTDQMIAVQICAAYQKLEADSRQQYKNPGHWELELNLVWRNDNDEVIDSSADIERTTLMTLGWQFHKLVPIAQTLAETLSVPLLNHATPSDWRDERQRAKDRPYVAVDRPS